MLNDDDPVGRVLSRREAITLLGASGLTLLGVRHLGAQNPRRMTLSANGGQVAACVVRPEQTEGPYFVDEKLHRVDIRSDPSDGSVSAGTPLELRLNVSRIVNGRCVPVPGAHVDIWQCDHAGVYSDVRDPRFDSTGRKFLRGYQVTDAAGAVVFTTIYPGWYQGRAVHIHFKVRSAPSAGRGFEFTSQLYFDEAMTDVVHAKEPYASRGQRTVRNNRDGIFRRQGGHSLILDVQPKADGYTGTFNVAIA